VRGLGLSELVLLLELPCIEQTTGRQQQAGSR
jgi:hypothetical protein